MNLNASKNSVTIAEQVTGIGELPNKSRIEKNIENGRRKNLPKNKMNLVLQVALSDRESFKILPTKKQQKKIYNRVLQRLKRQGYSGEILKNHMLEMIRQELFRIQPSFKPKQDNPVNEESFFDRRAKFVIKGSDIWGEHSLEKDPIQELEDNFNRTVTEGFKSVFCPRCHCERSCCRCHEGDEY